MASTTNHKGAAVACCLAVQASKAAKPAGVLSKVVSLPKRSCWCPSMRPKQATNVSLAMSMPTTYLSGAVGEESVGMNERESGKNQPVRFLPQLSLSTCRMPLPRRVGSFHTVQSSGKNGKRGTGSSAQRQRRSAAFRDGG